MGKSQIAISIFDSFHPFRIGCFTPLVHQGVSILHPFLGLVLYLVCQYFVQHRLLFLGPLWAPYHLHMLALSLPTSILPLKLSAARETTLSLFFNLPEGVVDATWSKEGTSWTCSFLDINFSLTKYKLSCICLVLECNAGLANSETMTNFSHHTKEGFEDRKIYPSASVEGLDTVWLALLNPTSFE